MQFLFEIHFLKAILSEIGHTRSIFIFFDIINSKQLYNRIHVKPRPTCSIMIFIPISRSSMKYFFLSHFSVIFCSMLVRQQLTNATSENIIVFIFDHWSETLETGLCSLSLRRLDLNSRGTRVISYTTSSSSNRSMTRKSLFSLLRKISRFILRKVSLKESIRNYSIQCILFLH